MIAADLVDDAFWCWSVPPARVEALLPHGLAPVLCDGRAWMAVAAARLSRVRVAGIPLPGPLVVAVTVVVVTCRGPGGRRMVGNYFIDGVTDSRLVAAGDHWFGGRMLHHSDVVFARDRQGCRLVVPAHVDLWLAAAGEVEPDRRQRLQRVFAGNRSGIIARRGRLFASGLTKDRWRMDPRPLRVDRAPDEVGRDAVVECGFDASGVHAYWDHLRPVTAA
jgi:hypothetical protein